MGLWLVAGASSGATTLKARCEAFDRALVFEADGVPLEVAQKMEAELEVEARRLGLEACRAADGVAAVTARVTWQPGAVRLEAIRQGRTLARDVPAGETEGNVLELALILGDLVREVVTPSERAGRTSWSLGARAALDGYPSFSGWLWGGDIVGRLTFARLALEASISGRGALSTLVPQGEVGMAGLGGGVSLLARALDVGGVRLHAEGGLAANALRLSGSAVGAVLGTRAWVGVVEARLGLALDLRVATTLFLVRAGMSFVLLGAEATADKERIVGVGGLGFFAGLGVALGGQLR